MITATKTLHILFFMILAGFPAVAGPSDKPSDPAKSVPTGTSKSSGKPAFVILAEKTQNNVIPRFEKPPVIDGKLDDEVWKSAVVLDNFFQIQPGDNIKPSQPTEVLLGYDSKNLYIAFRAHDDPSKVRSTVATRDNIWDDDYVGGYIDTFNDKRRAYALFFNPLGVQADGIFTEDRGEDYSIDFVMESKGAITDDGFTVEIAIPFKSLRYEVGNGKIWNAHFYRRIKRFNNELDSWMPFSRDIAGNLIQAGHLTGLDNVSTERTLEIIPTFAISESGKRIEYLSTNKQGQEIHTFRLLNKPASIDPGVTMKVGFSGSLTLDLTVNPDFAQVEADQTVVTANQRFPIFFDEKRPFFFEGIDIFRTPLNPLHTRTIIDPDFAAKFTGRKGRTSFGVLLASDNGPGNYSEEERSDPNTLKDIRKFLDKNAFDGVFRLKRDVGKESSLGVMGTSYNFVEKHNQTMGIDGRFKIDKTKTFSFQVIGTFSKQNFYDPAAGEEKPRTGNGLGYYYHYEMSGRHFAYWLEGAGTSSYYRADLGFTQRYNTNYTDAGAHYSSEPKPKATLINWGVFSEFAPRYDFQGRMQGWSYSDGINFSFKRQCYLNLQTNFGYEHLYEEEFGPKRTSTQLGQFYGDDSERSAYKHSFQINGGTTPSKLFSTYYGAGYTQGAFDYDFGATPHFSRVSPAGLIDPDAKQDPGPGDLFEVNTGFTLKPADSLRFSLDYTKSKLLRNDTKLVAYNDNIFSMNSKYQFTRFLFTRARIDYDTLSSRIQGQFLLGWTPNPGTSFYTGYNDNLNLNGFNPFNDMREHGLKRNGRTFFIKLSYLFRRSF